MVNFRTLSTVLLPPAARALVLQHCLHQHLKRIRVYAAVVMPDHLHLLFTPLRDEQTRSYSVAEVMQAIKGASAHSVNKLLARSGPVWQEEYFDHVVRKLQELAGEDRVHSAEPGASGAGANSARVSAALGGVRDDCVSSARFETRARAAALHRFGVPQFGVPQFDVPQLACFFRNCSVFSLNSAVFS
jgi:REP element-mobilizing transposase RayT